MKHLGRPERFRPGLFSQCVDHVENAHVKAYLQSRLAHIEERELMYYRHGEDGSLAGMPLPSVHDGRYAGDYRALYSESLLNGESRVCYNEIKARSRNRCAYCSVRTVRNLDHYLPKNRFFDLSVCAENLVPSCRDCNTDKGQFFADLDGNAIFHPYFDDWSDVRCIVAQLNFDNGLAVSFAERLALPEPFRTRVRTHLERLKLPELYATLAGSELSQKREAFHATFVASGFDGLKELVASEAQYRSGEINSWQYSLYDALASSDDFCAGRYIDIARV